MQGYQKSHNVTFLLMFMQGKRTLNVNDVEFNFIMGCILVNFLIFMNKKLEI